MPREVEETLFRSSPFDLANPVADFDPVGLVDYQRSPVGDWFQVADMGLYKTDLANWSTPAPDGIYYLKLTARNTSARVCPGMACPVQSANRRCASANIVSTASLSRIALNGRGSGGSNR